MPKIKFFVLTLFLILAISIYGSFYLANIFNFDTENHPIGQTFIKEEDQLLDDYALSKIQIDIEPDFNENDQVPDVKYELRVLTSKPNSKNHRININESLMIVFSDYVKLEDILGYTIKSGRGELCPSGNKPLAKNGKLIRCKNLNKLFLYKKGENEKGFEGSIKRSKNYENAITITPSEYLDISTEYILNIKSGLIAISSITNEQIELSDDKIISFETTEVKIEKPVEKLEILINSNTGENLLLTGSDTIENIQMPDAPLLEPINENTDEPNSGLITDPNNTGSLEYDLSISPLDELSLGTATSEIDESGSTLYTGDTLDSTGVSLELSNDNILTESGSDTITESGALNLENESGSNLPSQ